MMQSPPGFHGVPLGCRPQSLSHSQSLQHLSAAPGPLFSRNPSAEQRAVLGAQPVPYLLPAYALNYCAWRAEPGRCPPPARPPRTPSLCPGWGATVSPRPFLVGSRGSLLFQQPSFWSCYLSKWIPARLKKQSCFFRFWLLFFEMKKEKRRRRRDLYLSAGSLPGSEPPQPWFWGFRARMLRPFLARIPRDAPWGSPPRIPHRFRLTPCSSP